VGRDAGGGFIFGGVGGIGGGIGGGVGGGGGGNGLKNGFTILVVLKELFGSKRNARLQYTSSNNAAKDV
jgi:hypothetical protein